MNATTDRAARTGRRSRPSAPSRGTPVGYLGFNTALDARCEAALAKYSPATAQPSWQRAADILVLAAEVITEHGMPTRHAAARQQLAAFIGVYDRFFRLPTPWEHAVAPAPDLPLIWQHSDGRVVVDVVRTSPPSHVLDDEDTLTRARAAMQWATADGHQLAGVRLLALAAPGTSLLWDPVQGLLPLGDTELGAGLAPWPAGAVGAGSLVNAVAA